VALLGEQQAVVRESVCVARLGAKRPTVRALRPVRVLVQAQQQPRLAAEQARVPRRALQRAPHHLPRLGHPPCLHHRLRQRQRCHVTHTRNILRYKMQQAGGSWRQKIRNARAELWARTKHTVPGAGTLSPIIC
jgi:hypothetical protein